MLSLVRQLICIDLDGPILDVSERYYHAYRDSLESIDVLPLDKASYWELKRQKISEPEILKRSGVESPSAVEAYLSSRLPRIEAESYLRFDEVWPGTEETLKLLRAQGTLVLVTMRTSQPLLDEQLERLELRANFDCVLFAGPEFGANPRGERKAVLVRDCYQTGEISGWFIGDTETDMQSGRLLGLHTAAITFGIRTAEHLKPFSPDVMLNSPNELRDWARK